MPLAVAIPTRKPVKAPGPVPTTMAATDAGVSSSRSSRTAMVGRRVSP
jgi:hypothetical protein